MAKTAKEKVVRIVKNKFRDVTYTSPVDHTRTPQKQWWLEIYCENSSRTEAMAKTAKEKVVKIVIKK